MTTTVVHTPGRRAAVFEPQVSGDWFEDLFGWFDYEADAAGYTIVLMTEAELRTAHANLPAGFALHWAAPGRYVDDTEGAVIVTDAGDIAYEYDQEDR